MKALLIPGVILAALLLTACATVGPAVFGSGHPTPDQAATRFEKAVTGLADGLALFTDEISAGDRARLAASIVKGRTLLEHGRAMFDARQGDAAGLAREALAALSEAVPASASPRMKTALRVGQIALAAYVAAVPTTGAPTPPSNELKAARGAADVALATLLDRLGGG